MTEGRLSQKAAATPALVRVGAAEVRAAAAGVHDGRVFDLGLPIGSSTPQAHGPDGVPFSLLFSLHPERVASNAPFEVVMDAVTGSIHTSTHLDGLAHVSHHGAFFGDVHAARGVETVPPIVTRGVVLDIAGLHGVSRLPDGYEVSVRDVEKASRLIGVTIGTGDAVLVRTGKISQYSSDPAAYDAAQPGVGADAAVWMYDRGMAILGTDTSGTEPVPYGDRSTHVAMLVERGVHLIESMMLDDVREVACPVGLFVCLPLKIAGATGSWVRPVLVV